MVINLFGNAVMYIVFQEGIGYLDRNLTQWKKPFLMADGPDQEEESDSEEEAAPTSKAKPKMSKHTTMKGTAKVSVT